MKRKTPTDHTDYSPSYLVLCIMTAGSKVQHLCNDIILAVHNIHIETCLAQSSLSNIIL